MKFVKGVCVYVSGEGAGGGIPIFDGSDGKLRKADFHILNLFKSKNSFL